MWLRRILHFLGLDHWLFSLFYLRGRPPWDTGVTPPELVALVEGPQAIAPDYALDLGCGTGTNSLYLARHGWHVTGIDFATPAIMRAKEKARDGRPLSGSARFLRGDVTRLETLDAGPDASLVVDIGCLHTLDRDGRKRYADGVARHTTPGGLLLLYAFGRDGRRPMPAGIAPEEVRALFMGKFTVEQMKHGYDRGMTATWYWLRRTL